MNLAIVSGKVYGNVEIKRLPNTNASVANFAVINKYSTDKKTGKNKTFLFNFEAWGDQAQLATQLSNGDPVTVVGSIVRNDWEDKNTGEKRHAVKIRASQITPCVLPHVEVSQEEEPSPAPAPAPFVEQAASFDEEYTF
jgi:single-stranded DNA-binding protein